MTISDCSTTAEIEERLTSLDCENWGDEITIDEDALTAMVDRLLSE